MYERLRVDFYLTLFFSMLGGDKLLLKVNIVRSVHMSGRVVYLFYVFI